MTKNNTAFTLSEAMIVLGIVSVLAGLSIVAITNSKPDENIILFRRAYSTTAKVVQELLNDRELYPDSEAYKNISELGSVDNKKGFEDRTISDEVKTKYPYLEDVSERRKFAAIFAHKVNAITSEESGNYSVNFTTADGIYWTVSNCFYNGCQHMGHASSVPTDRRYGTVYIYLNGENTDKSCEYNSETCPYPTKFELNISSQGVITPQDPMACSYLRYPKATKNSQIPTSPTENNCFSAE